MIKTLIVSGGNVEEEEITHIYKNNKFNYIIASDGGLKILDKLNILPNYIIGDFDSIDKEVLNKYTDSNIEIRKLNPEKDYTDTHMALKLAIELKSKDITILGAIGTRMDHTIANIHILREAIEKDIQCKIINNNNEIKLINKTTIISKNDKYKYISLIPITTTVEGVTLTGFKYSLLNDSLKVGQSIGISNEQMDNKGIIDLKSGILILIQSKD